MLNFGIVDAIDIIIVAVLIFSILKLFRGTRGVLTIIGIFTLLLLVVIANVFNLKTLRFIVTGLGSMWVVIIVILFQNEIKRTITSIGSVGFSRYILREEREKIASEISEAVKVLSDKRLGALIVIERRTRLDPYMETGIKMEAVVDANLLVSIFSPFSPLHDGGVIIRGGYIVAAKAILPLSTNPNISPATGTRHRAAIGITEETDAICAVVSEETGTISFSKGGNLEKGLDPDALKNKILESLEKGGG